jgi:hypothetical protein
MILSGRFRAVTAPVAGTLLVLWLGAAVIPAQQAPTLAEIAKKEEERRKKITSPAKVYTNKDLPKKATVAPQPSATAPASTPAPAPGAPAAVQKPAEEQELEEPKEEKDEEWWRKRITAARAELSRNELAAEAFQSRVNALTTDFVNRDDPYQRAQISIDRQKALGELERVKAEVILIKQQIAAIEEEARQAGVPPGWLR